jgi:hypothetical protein
VLIVGGVFEVAPGERERFLGEKEAVIRASRAHDGCLEYTFAADPVEPGRVVLFERWADQAALDAHLALLRGDGAPPSGTVKPTSVSMRIYDVAGERSIGVT